MGGALRWMSGPWQDQHLFELLHVARCLALVAQSKQHEEPQPLQLSQRLLSAHLCHLARRITHLDTSSPYKHSSNAARPPAQCHIAGLHNSAELHKNFRSSSTASTVATPNTTAATPSCAQAEERLSCHLEVLRHVVGRAGKLLLQLGDLATHGLWLPSCRRGR